MTLPRNLAFFEVDPPVYENRLASRWRDLHVVDQTVSIAPEWYPIGGWVYLGMDPSQRLRSDQEPVRRIREIANRHAVEAGPLVNARCLG